MTAKNIVMGMIPKISHNIVTYHRRFPDDTRPAQKGWNRVKKAIGLWCAICLWAAVALPAFAAAPSAPEVTAPSALLMEASTGQVLFEKNSHDRRPPASVTKVMTMLLTMEAVDSGKIKMDDMVTASEYACGMGGSQVFLEPGEQMSVHDMLKAVAVASGNDAAVALSEHIAGSTEAFVGMMNERAAQLGMKDTHFVNCNGLDIDDHYTSAYDIALMSRELMTHTKIFDFTTIWMDSLRGGQFGLANTNKMIRFYEGATGLKTGSTSTAKFCVSATARRNDMDLIAVIMAAETSKDRFSDAKKLLDFGFANYAIANNTLNAEDLAPIPVEKGTAEKLHLEAGGASRVLVEKSRVAEVEKRITLPNEIKAPIARGDKIGEAEFSIGGEVVGTCDIVAAEDVAKMNMLQQLIRVSKYFLLGSKA